MEREEETDDVTQTPSNDTDKEVRCRGREDEGDTRSWRTPFMASLHDQTLSNDTEKEDRGREAGGTPDDSMKEKMLLDMIDEIICRYLK